jgi:single-stranded-DNA-specific exonuclease
MLKKPSPGMRALMDVSGLAGKQELSTGSISFGMAPRINAAGRLERAALAVEMLTTLDGDRARTIADDLDRCNSERQEVERTIVEQAREMIEARGGSTDRGAIVLGREGWHPGVIGIVAGRIAESYHRPTVIVALGAEHGQGSARSIPGFNLYDAIKACSSGLITFGGHSAAAGLKIPLGHLDAFAEAFDAHCRTTLTTEQLQKALTIDAEVPLGMLSLSVVEAIEKLEPHGIGNPKPVLVANRVRVAGAPRVVGERKNHVQLRFAQGDTLVKAVGFNLAERAKALEDGTICSVAFQPSINEWNGRREVQLEVKDFRIEDAGTNHAEPA